MKINIIFIAFVTFPFFICINCNNGFANITRPCAINQCNNSNLETLYSRPGQCRCDSFCSKYGDCCEDSPYANRSHPGVRYDQVKCSTIPGLNTTVLIWRGKNTISCKHSQEYDTQTKQFILKIPVTDTNSGITYGNRACARQNKITAFKYWNLIVICGNNFTYNITYPNSPKTLFDFPNSTSLKKLLSFKKNVGRWQIRSNNTMLNCTLIPSVPKSLATYLRFCDNNTIGFISNCAPNNTLQDPTKLKCPGYMSAVQDTSTGKWYRNDYCALCNGVPRQNIKCLGRRKGLQNVTSIYSSTNTSLLVNNTIPNKKGRRKGFQNVPSIYSSTNTSLLVNNTIPNKKNINTGTTISTTYRSVINATAVTDVSTTQMTTITSKRTRRFIDIISAPPPKPSKVSRKRAYIYLKTPTTCSYFLRRSSWVKVIAETLYINTMNRTILNKNITTKGSDVKVCNSAKKKSTIPDSDYYDDYISSYYYPYGKQRVRHVENAALLFTLLVWSLYIYNTFFGNNKVANPINSMTVYQKCLLSFSVSQMLLNIGLFMDNLFSWPLISESSFQYYLAKATHFMFVSSGCWTCILSLELIVIFINEFLDRTQTAQEQLRRFMGYSLLCWFAALFVAFFKSSSYTYGGHYELYTIVIDTSRLAGINIAFYICFMYVARQRPQLFDESGKDRNGQGANVKLHAILVLLTIVMAVSLHQSNNAESVLLWATYDVISILIAITVYSHQPQKYFVCEKIRDILCKLYIPYL